jgi:hypothetical protein
MVVGIGAGGGGDSRLAATTGRGGGGGAEWRMLYFAKYVANP